MPGIACLTLAAATAFAEPPASPAPQAVAEAGLPFAHNFDPSVYGGASQNWAVTQGPDGTIYVGNVEDGVLTFDGSRWQRIPIPNQLVVRSLTTAPDGRVYVGSVGDFGYLKPEATGQMSFVSLLNLVPTEERNFSDTWNIHVVGSDVYFATQTRIFHLHGDRVSVIKPQTTLHMSFLANDTLYVREIGRGLMRVVDNKLVPVTGGERFAEEKIYALLPWRGAGAKAGSLLVGTRDGGWFSFDGRQWKPWQTDARAALDEAAIYGAIWLTDGRLAVATLRGGLFLLDAHGHLLSHLNRANGLNTDVVLSMFQDRQRGLWLATGDGVSRVDVDSALTSFGERSGLKGAVLDIARHGGVLYVGTTEGLFRLVPGKDGNAYFEQLGDAPGQNWSFVSVDGQLLVAGNEGVFAVNPDGSARQLLDTQHAQRSWSAQPLLLSRRDPSRVFVGYKDGLGALHWTGSKWIDDGRIAGAQLQADTLAQDTQGQVWMGLYTGGVGRLALPADWQGPADSRPTTFTRFGSDDGLPAGKQSVVMVNDEIRFLTSDGIYRFDAGRERFEPDPAFSQLFPDGPRRVVALHQARGGELWMYTTDSRRGIKETGRARLVDGHWQWIVTPLQPISGIAMTIFKDDPDGIVWIGSDKALFRYDSSRKPNEDASFQTLVREVSTLDGRMLPTQQAGANKPEISYQQNALRFEFAAPSYDFFKANTFQVLLQGVDHGWSPWSSDAYRDYTNIHEGDYRFRVRARNVYGDEGGEATFDFRVLPPWYRTGWAWSIWIASGVLVIGVFLRWRSASLRRRNRELAALVDLRTTELAQANLALQDSNDALAEQSVTDPLTGLKNRRYLYDHIAPDLAMSRRNCRDQQRVPGQLPLNSDILFLMVDIDHFKEINDGYGHAAGDLVLQQFRDILQSVTRDTDIPIRWGGEEFLVVARFAEPDVGPQFAERIRAAVAAHSFDLGDGQSIHRTCSVGFATYPALHAEPDLLGWEQVVNLADECLYAAKRHGRDAWAGVMPLTALPEDDLIDALQAALAQPPGPAPLRVEVSWTQALP